VGAALSCADVMVTLYKRVLNVTAANLGDPARDYFFLSKGHAAPALYATLVEVGLLDADRLGRHLEPGDWVYWHPNPKIPGVEFHSGSLGHMLPLAVGVALDCRLAGQSNRVVVLTGDGELDEGSNWEACLLASAYQLDNLTIVVDRNGFQANMRTEELIPLEPLAAKFEAFGCQVVSVDGHDQDALEAAFGRLPFAPGKPSVVVAQTVRGRGLPSLEERADRWFCTLDRVEVAALLDELHRSQP
jgi:transketolase